jgi:adenine phosphoribosyltransferase
MIITEKIRNSIRDVQDFPKPGIVFKDITPILYDQGLVNDIVNEFVDKFKNQPLDAIVGIESRGFLFGLLLANRLNIPFVLVRKSGKLPYKTIQQDYDLEYGKSVIEMHVDSIQENWNVLIHDDLLATGGTAEATAKLIAKFNARVAGFSFLVGLDFLNGKEKLKNYSNNILCLIHY